MSYISYVSGNESHTSYWGKFYVKDLESHVVKEDHPANRRDNHHAYQCWEGEVPEGTIFTVFEQDGNKRGTDTWNYMICQVGGERQTISAGYGSGCIEGEFFIIAQASTKTKSPRLMDWWQARPKDADPLAYALRCAKYIEVRGIKDLPAE